MSYSDFLRQLVMKEQKADQSSCLDSLKIHPEKDFGVTLFVTDFDHNTFSRRK